MGKRGIGISHSVKYGEKEEEKKYKLEQVQKNAPDSIYQLLFKDFDKGKINDVTDDSRK